LVPLVYQILHIFLKKIFFCKSEFSVFFIEMAPLTLQQKAKCVIWMAQLDGPANVQKQIRRDFGISPSSKDMPTKQTLKNWVKEYLERGTSERKKRIGTK
jgi:hypothetical protein